MKRKTYWLMAALVAISLAAAPAMAYRGMGPGGGIGSDFKLSDHPKMSDEQKAKALEVEARFAPQLEQLKAKLIEHKNKMMAAVAKDETTMGQVRAMKAEMFDLKQAYQKVRFNQRQAYMKAGLVGHHHWDRQGKKGYGGKYGYGKGRSGKGGPGMGWGSGPCWDNSQPQVSSNLN